MKERYLVLAGNPNAGKTTLFNRLTGARESVGNRSGVTVEITKRRLKGGGAWLADLPGVYSLTAGSAEERLACACLSETKPDAIVNIVDATHLERNLYLTTQLMELGIPLIVALNMMDEAQRQGLRIDTHALSERLGVAVVPVSALSGAGVSALRARMLHPAAIPCVRPASSPEARYRWIAAVVEDTTRRRARRSSFSDRIDAVVTGAWTGIPIFLCLMALIFLLTFDTLGAWLGDGVTVLLGWLMGGAKTMLMRIAAPVWLISLLCDGLMSGLGGILAFLPQIALLFFLLSLLEDSGYMARAAFLTDRLLGRFGLSGRACISLLMGFGCTVPAALAARTLPGRRERRRTIRLLPFMSCSAKLPVYALMTAAFFPAHRGLVMLGLYISGVAGGFIAARLTRGGGRADADAGFVLELPPYRLPRLKNTLLFAAERIQHFISRAGTVILFMSMLLWLMTNFSFSLCMVADPRDGMLAALGGMAAPLLAPLGFGFWQAAVALLTGLVAKEAVVSTLLLLCAAEGTQIRELFTPVSALSFLVFVLLYSPCAAALATMKRELGGARHALFAALYQTALAFLAAGLVRLIGELFAG